MDERRAAAVLAELAERLGDRVVLWRGAGLTGSDLDLAVLPGAEDELRAALTAAGLADAGAGEWRDAAADVVVDVVGADDWPASYPPLADVAARARPGGGVSPVAAPEDRALILAAEAVAGRPLAKVVSKLRSALAEPGAHQRLGERARQEGGGTPALAMLAERLAAGSDPAGTLGWRAALPVAARSPRARSALRTRASAAIERRARRLVAPSSGPGLLIGLNGMDGAGKTSAALAIERRLRERGERTKVDWARLGQRSDVLDLLAKPLKRVLRRDVTIGDPLATRGDAPAWMRQDERVAAGRLGPLGWTWVLIVLSLTLRDYHVTAARTCSGASIVAERWAADTLVDLWLRYGRHRGAEWLLRNAVARPDVSLLLEIDAETSMRRKPGDQPEPVVRRMEGLYDRAAALVPVERIDARRPQAEVLAEVLDLVDAALEARARRRASPSAG